MKKNVRFLTILVVLTILCTILCVPAYAAKPTMDILGALAVGTSEKDAQFYAAVCVREDGENYIYSSIRPISNQFGYYVSLIGKDTLKDTNEIYDTGSFEEWQNGIFRAPLGEANGSATQADDFPTVGSVGKNDTVYFSYFVDEDYITEKSTVKRIRDGVLTTNDQLEEELADKDFAIIFNDSSEVVGFMKNGTVYTIQSANTFPTELVLILAGIVAVIVAVVVVVIVIKKNKKSSQFEVATTGDTDLMYGTDELDDTETTLNENINNNMNINRRGLFVLVGHGGAMNGRTYPIGLGGLTIGRAPNNSIVYPDKTPGISRNHVKLFFDASGQLMVMDTGSTYGTYIDGAGKLAPMKPTPLRSGSIFYVGERVNAFELVIR